MKRIAFAVAFVLSSALVGLGLGTSLFGRPPAPRVALGYGHTLAATVERAGDVSRITSSSGASVEVSSERLAALTRARASRRVEEPARAAIPDDAATSALRSTVASLTSFYSESRRDLGDRLVTEHPRIVRWDEAATAVPGLRVAAMYRDLPIGGEMELDVVRPSAGEPVAIAFPPGTYGHAPAVQELAFLRAPVVVLGTQDRRASVRIPVACASFNLHAPTHDMVFELRTFESGSAIDQLMVALCSGAEMPGSADAQLAVWITRNEITQGDLLAHGGVTTFQNGARVTTRNAAGAAALIKSAGLAPEALPWFRPVQQRQPQVEAVPEMEM
jgi:hypothetical protein